MLDDKVIRYYFQGGGNDLPKKGLGRPEASQGAKDKVIISSITNVICGTGGKTGGQG